MVQETIQAQAKGLWLQISRLKELGTGKRRLGLPDKNPPMGNRVFVYKRTTRDGPV
ncbi:MAG: hypothetical protein Ct9H300mP23_10740 [Nitrospinota bacterium]|nr:MAG: hypothetical protein Ct9H300mP23_10740 [Nitrospinota bacterium]